MNLQKKLSLGLMALAVAVIVSAVPANAQQLYKATFDLPFEAQYGNTVLEPGEYTITVEEALGQKVIRFHGAAELAILAGPSSPESVTDNGRLTFVSVNGVYMLKKFDASAIGRSFVFPTFKAKGERGARTADAPEATAVALSTH